MMTTLPLNFLCQIVRKVNSAFGGHIKTLYTMIFLMLGKFTDALC